MNLREAFTIVLDLAWEGMLPKYEGDPEDYTKQMEAWALVHAAGRRINGDTKDD